jgi:uncharacterized protein YyaL (SSP411 family)
MISALAKAHVILGDRQYLEAAERAMSWLLGTMYDARSGQLLRRFCDGEAAVPGFLDDYAFLAQASIDMFETSFDPHCLDLAFSLARAGLTQFEDSDQGGFFSTAENASDLLLRIKDDYDGAEPSGNSVATDVLLRLAHLTGNTEFRDRAERSLRWFAPKLKAQPTIAPQMLVALGRSLGEPEQVVLRCATMNAEAERKLSEYRRTFAPNSVVLAISDASAEALKDIAPFLAALPRKGRMTLYECRNFACETPQVIE